MPHTLRRTYISRMLEAGAPLHYVMDQVGHEDSKATLEIYPHVQKRVSRPHVKRAFRGAARQDRCRRARRSGRASREDIPQHRRTVEIEARAVRQTTWSTKSSHKRGIKPPRMTPNSLPHPTRKAPHSTAFRNGHGWA
ncbi:MAG: tyrosine-type recombinase/integrase [Solirubrobacteraceae bacterium]